MSTFVECRISDAFGVPLATVANFADSPQGAALDYALNVGQVGVLSLTVPPSFDDSLFKLDGRIGVWRSINGGPMRLDGDSIFFIRTWEYTDHYTRVIAYHANHIMWRRIVAYGTDNQLGIKIIAQPADDLIKEIAAQQLVTGVPGIVSLRDGVETQADIGPYGFTIQVDLGLAPNQTKVASRRILAEVINEICQTSTLAGTYLAAEVVSPTESTLELRTFATQRGVDHRASTAQPVILGPQRGNLENAKLVIDRSKEITFAVAGGAGTGAGRIIATALDSVRMAESPYNRLEQFIDCSNATDTTLVQGAADAAVRGGKPSIVFTGDLVETGATTRGIHFDLGDIVTAEFRGQQYDVRLDVVHETFSQGRRSSQVQLRSVS